MTARPGTTVRFESWPAILDHALDAVDEIPAGHNLNEVRFGTYAASVNGVGGTHYVWMGVNYAAGNTADAQNPAPQPKRKRRLMVIEAWERAAHPAEDPE